MISIIVDMLWISMIRLLMVMLDFKCKFPDPGLMAQIINIMKLCYFRIIYLKVMYISYLRIIQNGYKAVILMYSTFSIVHGQFICMIDKKNHKKRNKIGQEYLYL